MGWQCQIGIWNGVWRLFSALINIGSHARVPSDALLQVVNAVAFPRTRPSDDAQSSLIPQPPRFTPLEPWHTAGRSSLGEGLADHCMDVGMDVLSLSANWSQTHFPLSPGTTRHVPTHASQGASHVPAEPQRPCTTTVNPPLRRPRHSSSKTATYQPIISQT